MAIPKYDDFMFLILKWLQDGKEKSAKQLRMEGVKHFHLTDAEQNKMLPSGRQTIFANRIGWAIAYLKQAGLIKPVGRGVFIITPDGKKVLADNPNKVDKNYLMRFDSFRRFQGQSEETSSAITNDAIDKTPDDTFEEAFQKINCALQEELLQEISKLSPTAFEQMVLDLLAKMGYGTFENASQTTAASGDEGIDGIIMQDKLGFDLIYMQAKQWNEDHQVGRPEVQAFVGAIAGRGGKGLFVTTSYFSKPAIEYAKTQHLILIDGNKLTKYMIEYNFGVTEKRCFSIKAIDTDVFNDYAQ